MIKHFCDACGTEDNPHTMTQVTPGYLSGPRYVCSACWGKWVNFVLDFFQEPRHPEVNYDE